MTCLYQLNAALSFVRQVTVPMPHDLQSPPLPSLNVALRIQCHKEAWDKRPHADSHNSEKQSTAVVLSHQVVERFLTQKQIPKTIGFCCSKITKVLNSYFLFILLTAIESVP